MSVSIIIFYLTVLDLFADSLTCLGLDDNMYSNVKERSIAAERSVKKNFVQLRKTISILLFK